MTHICPSCGYNLTADAAVERDGWCIDPRGAASYRGVELFTRNTWVQILFTCASMTGIVKVDVLQARISDSEESNVAASQLSLMRKRLAYLSVPCPIETVRGDCVSGYRWRVN